MYIVYTLASKIDLGSVFIRVISQLGKRQQSSMTKNPLAWEKVLKFYLNIVKKGL